MDQHFLKTTGEKLTDEQRLEFVRNILESHNLTHHELARYTGYARETVSGWLTDTTSPRYRPVPARAVDRLLFELNSGNVKGSK